MSRWLTFKLTYLQFFKFGLLGSCHIMCLVNLLSKFDGNGQETLCGAPVITHKRQWTWNHSHPGDRRFGDRRQAHWEKTTPEPLRLFTIRIQTSSDRGSFRFRVGILMRGFTDDCSKTWDFLNYNNISTFLPHKLEDWDQQTEVP